MLAPDIDLKTFVDLIDNAYDEVFIWDCNLRVVYANKASYRHYGFSPEEFIGKKVDELVLQDALWSPTIVSSTFSKKKPLMQKQKSVLGVEMVTISVPIFGDNGKVEFVVQTIRDTDEFLYREVEPMTSPDMDREEKKNIFSAICISGQSQHETHYKISPENRSHQGSDIDIGRNRCW